MYEFTAKRNDTHESKTSLHKGKARTEIPVQLKTRTEDSTRVPFNYVRANYNSDKPAKLDTLAYTNGNQVGISPGQKRYSAYDLRNAMQQKLNAVRASVRYEGNEAINTDVELERQSDVSGVRKNAEILQGIRDQTVQRMHRGQQQTNGQMVVQRCKGQMPSPEQVQQAREKVISDIRNGKIPELNGKPIIGLYEDVGGHHPHSQAAFRGNPNYDKNLAISISNDGLRQMGISHNEITQNQKRFYKPLKNNPNISLSECSAIERASMKDANVPSDLADLTILCSTMNLNYQGATPTRIPYSKNNKKHP